MSKAMNQPANALASCFLPSVRENINYIKIGVKNYMICFLTVFTISLKIENMSFMSNTRINFQA